MSNILFAWELGGNIGHLAKQLMIARSLQQRGHCCSFAVRDVSTAFTLFAADNFEINQAPFYFDPAGESQLLISFADILSVNGFEPFETLRLLVEEWHALFVRTSPDVVITEFSPIAVLAAKLHGKSVLRIDNGFGSPPDQQPFPSFRPWIATSSGQIFESEQKLLENINQLCGHLRHSPFKSLQDMLSTEVDLLTTVPELDHYPVRNYGMYVGPLFNLADGVKVEWSQSDRSRIFVYLRNFDGLEFVLRTLDDNSLDVIAVLPGIDENIAVRYAGRFFQIFKEPVFLPDILPHTDIAITNGGHGLASLFMMKGIPMIVIPQMLEQLMTANNIERLGIGLSVNHDQVPKSFVQTLARLFLDDSLRKQAIKLSQKYADYDQNPVLENISDTIEGVMRRKYNTSLTLKNSWSLPYDCLPGREATIMKSVPTV